MLTGAQEPAVELADRMQELREAVAKLSPKRAILEFQRLQPTLAGVSAEVRAQITDVINLSKAYAELRRQAAASVTASV